MIGGMTAGFGGCVRAGDGCKRCSKAGGSDGGSRTGGSGWCVAF